MAEAPPLPEIRDSVRLRIDLLDPMEDNPQVQSGAVFGQMVQSIREIGQAETVLVSGPFPNGRYKIVSGHHKVDAAKVAGLTELSCMVLPPMTDDEIKIWVVRMNAIRGELDPFKFTKMFNELARKYDPATLRAKMGITSEETWKQLYRDVRKTLPPEVAKKLDQARKEITDVESLANVVRKVFAEHGHTLDHRLLVFEWGGKSHFMVKMTSRTAQNVDRICQEAVERKVDVNFLFNRLLEQHLPDEALAPGVEAA